MYLNKITSNSTPKFESLTLTWDVFKSDSQILLFSILDSLTLTWDVFKLP